MSEFRRQFNFAAISPDLLRRFIVIDGAEYPCLLLLMICCSLLAQSSFWLILFLFSQHWLLATSCCAVHVILCYQLNFRIFFLAGVVQSIRNGYFFLVSSLLVWLHRSSFYTVVFVKTICYIVRLWEQHVWVGGGYQNIYRGMAMHHLCFWIIIFITTSSLHHVRYASCLENTFTVSRRNDFLGCYLLWPRSLTYFHDVSVGHIVHLHSCA